MYCDAIEYMFMAAHLHYRLMQVTVRPYCQQQAELGAPRIAAVVVPFQDRATILASAMALVGTINRLRHLIRRLHGDRTTRMARKVYEAAVCQVEPVRHLLEHVDTQIPKTAQTAQGAFGTISWWWYEGKREGKKSRLIWMMTQPGHLAPGHDRVTIAETKIPSNMREDIDHFWVMIGDEIFDLSDVYWAVVKLEERLRAWSKEQSENGWPALRPPDQDPRK